MEPENLFSMKFFLWSSLFLLVSIDSVNILNDLKNVTTTTATATTNAIKAIGVNWDIKIYCSQTNFR